MDLLFDCRFLPNPYWDEALRTHSGLEPEVRKYVLDHPETAEFLAKVEDLLTMLMPAYVREGKSYLTVAMGCTGGRHRSVVLAEELVRRLELTRDPEHRLPPGRRPMTRTWAEGGRGRRWTRARGHAARGELRTATR